jgi:anti-sigma regulatory factor (Ser/Thr protein kinase)
MSHSFWSHATTLPPEPGSASASRRFVRAHLESHGLSVMCPDVELVTSELATNAVHHAGTAFTLSLEGDDRSVRVSSRDFGIGGTVEALSPSNETAVGGRGLLIVDTMSTDWGVTQETTTTLVWACFDIPAARG